MFSNWQNIALEKAVVFIALLFFNKLNAQEIIQTDTVKSVLEQTDSVISKPRMNDTALQFAEKPIDSTSKKKPKINFWTKHKPGTAVLFSALVPGLGQAYNKKYWKVPIVYAGLGGLSYAVYYTATNFQQARDAYRIQIDGDDNTWRTFKGIDDAATLKEYRDYYKKNLDISAICLGVWYALNLIDAAVDAHLFRYDVNDKLSLEVFPSSQYNALTYSSTPSLSLRVSLIQ